MEASPDLIAVSTRVDEQLSENSWSARHGASSDIVTPSEAAADVATFALKLSGKRRAARRQGRLSRLVLHIALAATLTLASLAAACDKPQAGPSETAVALQSLSSTDGSDALVTASPRASPARYTDLALVDPSSASPALLMTSNGSPTAPVLVDAAAVGAPTATGAVFTVPGHAIPVGTRDGPTQFIVADGPLEQTADSASASVQTLTQQAITPWQQDQRVLAAERAITGQPTVLDAAYNAQAAVDAGGTQTYLDGVVLRVDPDNAALAVIDRSLLESGVPTRPSDVVNVAIRSDEQSLYSPGTVVNLRDVVMTRQQSDVDGQQMTFYVANAALDGARVEPTGTVDLQSLLNQRLQLTDADLQTEAQAANAAPTPARCADGNAGRGADTPDGGRARPGSLVSRRLPDLGVADAARVLPGRAWSWSTRRPRRRRALPAATTTTRRRPRRRRRRPPRPVPRPARRP